MRTVALISVALFLTAPNLAGPSLDAAQVSRVIAVAEATTVTDGNIGPAGLAGLQPDAAALKRHGLDADDWRLLARRIAVAYEAQRMADMGGLRTKARTLAVADGLSAGERRSMSAILDATRHDLAAMEAETAVDRAAIQPHLERLGRILGP